MTSRIASVALVVPDYDVAIDFFCNVMGFRLVQDLDQGRKRWVTVEPVGGGVRLVLARAEGEAQRAAIGHQAGGSGCFWKPTISAAIMRGCRRRGCISRRRPGMRFTVSWPSGATRLATVGT